MSTDVPPWMMEFYAADPKTRPKRMSGGRMGLVVSLSEVGP